LIGGWNVATLKEHISEILREKEARYMSEFGAAKNAAVEARLSAETAMQKAEAATRTSREEVERGSRALNESVSRCVSRLDNLEGERSGLSSGWLLLMGLLSMLASLVAVVVSVTK
jgi:hypothetical protein